MAGLKISNLSVAYNLENSTVTALDGVSLEFPTSGYTLGVVGESGSGKTTLGMSIMNLIEPPGRVTNGQIEYDGRNVLDMGKQELRSYRWREVSMVYQSAMNSLNPVKRVVDPIIEVLRSHTDVTRAEARKRAVELLSECGIKPERVGDYPHELSGGMRQRVVIALALALSPKVLIADEPTSALDVVIQKQILALLKREVAQKKLSLLFITHEISLLGDLVQEIAVMYAGEIVEVGATSKLFFEPLHPYTEMLIGTLLTLDSPLNSLGSRDESEEEEANNQLPRNACKYANRCKYAFDRCKKERPKLLETQDGRWVACHKFN